MSSESVPHLNQHIKLLVCQYIYDIKLLWKVLLKMRASFGPKLHFPRRKKGGKRVLLKICEPPLAQNCTFLSSGKFRSRKNKKEYFYKRVPPLARNCTFLPSGKFQSRGRRGNSKTRAGSRGRLACSEKVRTYFILFYFFLSCSGKVRIQRLCRVNILGH